jgi:hypothetical protein
MFSPGKINDYDINGSGQSTSMKLNKMTQRKEKWQHGCSMLLLDTARDIFVGSCFESCRQYYLSCQIAVSSLLRYARYALADLLF